MGGSVLTLAVVAKVTRQDGVILGFSSHDADLTLEGVVYEAGAAMDGSAIRTDLAGGISNMEIIGLLNSERIEEADLLAGLYEHAAVELAVVNWSDLSQGRLVLLTGNIGEVSFSDGRFVVELRGLMQRLNQQVGAVTSPACRVKQLGDAECKVSLAGYQFSRSVYSVTSATVLTFDSDTSASDTYTYGRVIFTSGLNDGFEREVKRHILTTGRAQIELQEAAPYVVSPGDVATLEVGCDRRLETCRDVFFNVQNMRAEPFVPGLDQLLRRGRR